MKEYQLGENSERGSNMKNVLIPFESKLQAHRPSQMLDIKSNNKSSIDSKQFQMGRSPVYNHKIQRSNTNNVLIMYGLDETPKDIFYFIPAYLRLKIKNFTELDLDTLNSTMNCVIWLTIYYGELDKYIIKEILNNLVLNLNNKIYKVQLESDQTKMKLNQKHCTASFEIQTEISFLITPDVFWSPFQLIGSKLTIQLKNFEKQHQLLKDGSKIKIRFNLMDNENSYLKFHFEDKINFKNYDLAQKKINVTFSNKSISQIKQQDKYKYKNRDKLQPQIKIQANKNNINQAAYINKLVKGTLLVRKQSFNPFFNKVIEIDENLKQGAIFQKKDKIKNFKYAHFEVFLYKLPLASLMTIFVPLSLLSLLNVSVYFEGSGQINFANRVVSLSTLLIAFVALIPVIRGQLPYSPKITLVQILVIFEAISSLLCLIEGGVYTIFKWNNDPFFLISMIITVLIIFIMLAQLIIHKLVWEPSYNLNSKQVQKVIFKPQTWSNLQCDLYFKNCPIRYRRKLQVFAVQSLGKNHLHQVGKDESDLQFDSDDQL